MAETVRFHVYRKNITVGLLMDMEDMAGRLAPGPDGTPAGSVSMREMHDMLLPFAVSANGRQLSAEDASRQVRRLNLDEMQAAFTGIFEQLNKISGDDVPPTSDGAS